MHIPYIKKLCLIFRRKLLIKYKINLSCRINTKLKLPLKKLKSTPSETKAFKPKKYSSHTL